MKYLVRYAYLAPGGGWSSVETIATETYPVYTAVAGDCLGTPHVLWNVRDQEDNRLRYAVKDPEHGWAVSTSQEMEAAHLWVSEGLSLAVECPATHSSGGRHAAWDTGPVYTPYDPADGRGEIYSTSLAGEPPSSIFLTSSGGRLHSFSGSAHYHFAPASVLTDTFVTHVPTGSPPTGNLQPVTIFELTAEQASDGVPLSAFQKPYTLTMTYSPASLGTAIESSLQVYAWDGGQWTALPGTLDIANHQVTAQTDQVGYLALLGETKRVYLPITCRGQ